MTHKMRSRRRKQPMQELPAEIEQAAQEANLRSLMDAPLPTAEQFFEAVELIQYKRGEAERDRWKQASMARFTELSALTPMFSMHFAAGLELGYYLGRHLYAQEMAAEAAEMIHQQMLEEGVIPAEGES